MIMISVLILLSLFGPSLAHAACGGSSPNLTAASVNRQDVVDCHTAAVTGDTITIPAGTATDWTSTVTITKAVTLKGAGAASTIIEDNIVGGTPLISVTLVANQTTRLTDFQVVGGSRTANASSGVIAFDAGSNTVDSRRFILDNCILDHVSLLSIGVFINRAYGLIHHCTFTQTPGRTSIYAFTGAASDPWTDDRWAGADDFGTDNFIFIEDSTFTHDTGQATRAFVDAYGGSRYVFRHNSVQRGYLEAHGTESASRRRGTRAVEVYENDWDNAGSTGENTFLNLRSGVALVYNNTGVNMTNATAINLKADRTTDLFSVWSIADGFNPWDANDAGNPIVSGTVSSATTSTMTDSTQSWTSNQYLGYVVRKVTAPCNVSITAVNTTNERLTAAGHGLATGDTVHIAGHSGSTPHIQGGYTVTVVDSDTFTLNGVDITSAGSGGTVSLNVKVSDGSHHVCSSLITANTSTQLTFQSAFFGTSQNISFSAGDAYQINRITQIFDQPGVMGGTDLNGVLNPTWPVSNDQTISIVYESGNTNNGGDLDISVGTALSQVLIENTHYKNDTTAPGYTAYTYPHPSNTGPSGGGGGGAPPASSPRRFDPVNLRRADAVNGLSAKLEMR